MDKPKSELLELLAFYDDLTTKQADYITQMSRKIAEQARVIALLQDDAAEDELFLSGM